jgi:hypothetical protein
MPSCVKLAGLQWVNRHIIHRKLNNLDLKPYDLFQEIKWYFLHEWWVISVDDSVLDKRYSVESKWDILGWFWSGKHHKEVLWIDLLTLFYTDSNWVRLPINWRVVDKSENKTKNEYFREMVDEVLIWWISPSIVTWDCWFSWEENLKFVLSKGLDFLFSIKSNRQVSLEPWVYQAVSKLQIPKEWITVHLKNIGFVRVFQDDDRFYAFRSSKDETKRDSTKTNKFTRIDFDFVHKMHWGIEEYHRCIKQVCNVEWHFLRNKSAVLNHIFCSLRAFCVLEVNRSIWKLNNRYSYLNQCMKQYMSQVFNNVSLSGLIIQTM